MKWHVNTCKCIPKKKSEKVDAQARVSCAKGLSVHLFPDLGDTSDRPIDYWIKNYLLKCIIYRDFYKWPLNFNTQIWNGEKSVTIRTVDFILVEQLSLNVLKNIYFLIPLWIILWKKASYPLLDKTSNIHRLLLKLHFIYKACVFVCICKIAV